MKKSLGLLLVGGIAAVWTAGNGNAAESPAPQSNYVSPEFIAAAPGGARMYVTSATGARILDVALDGSSTRSCKVCYIHQRL